MTLATCEHCNCRGRRALTALEQTALDAVRLTWRTTADVLRAIPGRTVHVEQHFLTA